MISGAEQQGRQQRDIVLEVPTPHSKKQKLLHQAFEMPGVREIWAACGTKFGKSVGVTSGFCSSMIQRPNTLWRWVAPIYEQADIGLSYCRSILPKDPQLVDVNRSRMEITIPDIGTVVKFRHAQDPTSLEGVGIAGDVFDECAKIKREAYDSAKTTRTKTGGVFVGVSTPMGKNWFYHKCMEAKEEMEWCVRNGKQTTRIFITAPTTANPLISKEAIEEAKRDLPDRLFRQYYLAEFIDDGTVFTNFRDCLGGPQLDVYGEHQAWYAPDAKERKVVLGADWAKTIDWTVFFAIDYESTPPRVVGFERFHKRPYIEAVKKWGHFGRHFDEVAVGYHDKTGVGAAIDEMCHELPFPTQGITFTNQSKTEMVNRTISRFELRDLAIPNWPELIRELDSYEVRVNAIGTMSYSAPGTLHDDTVSALMLAVAALGEHQSSGDVITLGEDERRPKDDGPKEIRQMSAMEQFYHDLAEDAEDD